MREQTKIKLDYLSETKEALKNLLIEKGQTVADTDTFRSYVDKFRTLLEASGGATETDIIPLQDAPFTQNTQGIYEWYITPAPTALKAGETYHVKWGEDEYTLTAVDASAILSGGVALGNLGIYGMADTGEPFLFAYVPNYGGTGVATLGCLTLETDATHTIRVYQDATSGASKFLMTSGEFTSEDASASITVAHGHGRVPDIVFVYKAIPPFMDDVLTLLEDSPLYYGGVYFSTALVDAINAGKKDESIADVPNAFTVSFNSSSWLIGTLGDPIDKDGSIGPMMGLVRNCNQNSFIVGGSTTGYKLMRGFARDADYNIVGYKPAEYKWVAISGLT